MKKRTWVASLTASVMTVGLLAGCGGSEPAQQGEQSQSTPAPAAETVDLNAPVEISLVMQQSGDIPPDDSEAIKLIEEYTNSKIDITWIPTSEYDEKINVLLASSDFPKMMKVRVTPTVISAMQSGQFWEIGPYLKDYKNLSAQNQQYYDNIAIEGKVYGVPAFRDLARGGFIYRKDWFDSMGLKQPTTTEEWYNVVKTLTTGDPDKNGKADTNGILLYKTYNDGNANMLNRLAVSLGAPNKWAVDASGKFTPDFMAKEHLDTLKLLRRLYEEKLINQDFAVLDESEANKKLDAGLAGIRVSVATNAKGMHERLVKTLPNASFDVEPLRGPQGIRPPGELGNNGYFVFPKQTVETEADLRRLLAFADKMMEAPMATLLTRGIEGKHHKKLPDGKVEFLDFNQYQRDLKSIRDNLFYLEGYNTPDLNDVPIGIKQQKVVKENTEYAVPNPALSLISEKFNERGAELEVLVQDAQTKFIMGQIDEAGLQAEYDRWRKDGGDQIAKEYEEAYKKLAK